MIPGGFGFQPDPFGGGGITYQLDNHLRSLEEATKLDDARLYANLVAQVATILRPKLEAAEYERLSHFKVETPKGLRRREANREYERELFEIARRNLAELLLLASQRGIYAKEDASDEPADGSGLALKG